MDYSIRLECSRARWHGASDKIIAYFTNVDPEMLVNRPDIQFLIDIVRVRPSKPYGLHSSLSVSDVSFVLVGRLFRYG